MIEPIRRVGVIGAGVMGSGIAAHLANGGVDAVLLDIVPPDLSDKEKNDPKARNRLADEGLQKAVKAKPAAFFHKDNARLVTTGNLDDHIERLAECDLVIEAIVERLDIKQKLFERLEKVLPQNTLVASNTSGLPIANMLEGRSEAFQRNFLVMHFFNPVRYMKLLELVPGPKTDDGALERVRYFGKEVLGKGIVLGKDTPNFVGNRIGTHSMMTTIHTMLEMGLQPEDVDAITGRPMAHPKSASFRTGDLVGVDTFVHVADNCYAALENDEERDTFKVPDYIRTLVERNLLGNKTGGGFYKKQDGEIFVFDPYDLDYRKRSPDPDIRAKVDEINKIADPGERIRRLLQDDGKAGTFAWRVLSRSLAYATRRVGEIADRVDQIDDAMRWGYAWDVGPFQGWDAVGFREAFERMKNDGLDVAPSVQNMYDAGAEAFYRGDTVYDLQRGEYVDRGLDPRNATLQVLRRGNKGVLENDGAEAWDLGDGVLAFTYKTYANTLDENVISLLYEAATKAEQEFGALLIFNQGDNFSVGANLFNMLAAAKEKQWDGIRDTVRNFQGATQRLKYARVPVVAAPFGMTLGGGLEVCLCADKVQAAAETYAGLVEPGVGLIPGGAGNLNLLWRALEGVPEGTTVNIYNFVTRVFQNIAMASVATSAQEAKHWGYLHPRDGLSFDRERHVSEAKAAAVGLANAGYHPPLPRAYRLAGESGIATLEMMLQTMRDGNYITDHDMTVSRHLARVLCGGTSGASKEVTEDEMLELEREAFVSLAGEPKSQERMEYMLNHNKPLRN